MKDSDIPDFTAKVLAACKQAVKEGWWKDPRPPGVYNGHCCPIMALALVGDGLVAKEVAISNSFMSGYDLRDWQVEDRRFYILGQGFRKIAETTRFQ